MVKYKDRISDRMDRRKVLVGIAFAAITVALLIVVLQPRVPWLVLALVVIFGAQPPRDMMPEDYQ